MKSLKSLRAAFLEAQTNHTMKQGQKALLDRQYNTAVKARSEAVERLEILQKTQILLLEASGTVRAAVTQRIESIVTNALCGITGEPYGFKVELTQSSGAWSVAFKVISPSGIELDPIDQCGGGIADIVSMTLRIAVLEMYEPRIEGPVLWDETFKYLSKDYIRTAVEWIRQYMSRMKRQVILVTHVPEFADGADKVFEVQPQGDTSKVIDVTASRSVPVLP